MREVACGERGRSRKSEIRGRSPLLAGRVGVLLRGDEAIEIAGVHLKLSKWQAVNDHLSKVQTSRTPRLR